MFRYGFALTKHKTEIKNHLELSSNVKLFFDLYNRPGIEYPTCYKKNSYTLFEKKNNQEIGFGNWRLLSFKMNFLNLI